MDQVASPINLQSLTFGNFFNQRDQVTLPPNLCNNSRCLVSVNDCEQRVTCEVLLEAVG